MGAGTPPGTADGVGVPETEAVEGIHGDVKKVPETGDDDQKNGKIPGTAGGISGGDAGHGRIGGHRL